MALAADFHSSDTFIPSLDDFAVAQRKVEGLAGIDGAVEFFARSQPAGVMHANAMTFLGDLTIADPDVPVLQSGICFYAFARNLK